MERLGIADSTPVMFSSDNGPHNESNYDLVRFNPSGSLRSIKRDLYDGGIRAPFLAWWPRTVGAGRTSDHIS